MKKLGTITWDRKAARSTEHKASAGGVVLEAGQSFYFVEVERNLTVDREIDIRIWSTGQSTVHPRDMEELLRGEVLRDNTWGITRPSSQRAFFTENSIPKLRGKVREAFEASIVDACRAAGVSSHRTLEILSRSKSAAGRPMTPARHIANLYSKAA